MPRYVALLRGINVGGHTVKMDPLRDEFERMGFANVSTFIASGNVVFESDEGEAAALETMIEQRLLQWLGYEVATFLRVDAEIARIAEHVAFPEAPRYPTDTEYVLFLRGELDPQTRNRVL